MISLIVFTVLLFAILWGWLALEYKKAILLTIEEEMELEHWMTVSKEKSLINEKNYKVLESDHPFKIE